MSDPRHHSTAGNDSCSSLILRVYGCEESAVKEAVTGLLGAQPAIQAEIDPASGGVKLRLSFPAQEAEAAALIGDQLRQQFGPLVFAADEAVEEAVVAELAQRGETLAVAESCTGGLLAGAITDVSGSSAVFRGGVIAYHNDLKVELLGVKEEILENAGAVSEPVAQWMAVGARERLGADYGIGITGIAGPAGGTPEKPVGLVYICVSSRGKDVVQGFSFDGGRAQVRRAAVVTALQMLGQIISPIC